MILSLSERVEALLPVILSSWQRGKRVVYSRSTPVSPCDNGTGSCESLLCKNGRVGRRNESMSVPSGLQDDGCSGGPPLDPFFARSPPSTLRAGPSSSTSRVTQHYRLSPSDGLYS